MSQDSHKFQDSHKSLTVGTSEYGAKWKIMLHVTGNEYASGHLCGGNVYSYQGDRTLGKASVKYIVHLA
jgi:hypothetical protein